MGVVSLNLANRGEDVLDRLIYGIDHGVTQSNFQSGEDLGLNIYSESTAMNVIELILKTSYERMIVVCLALASITTSPIFRSTLPSAVLDAICAVYFPKVCI